MRKLSLLFSVALTATSVAALSAGQTLTKHTPQRLPNERTKSVRLAAQPTSPMKTSSHNEAFHWAQRPAMTNKALATPRNGSARIHKSPAMQVYADMPKLNGMVINSDNIYYGSAKKGVYSIPMDYETPFALLWESEGPDYGATATDNYYLGFKYDPDNSSADAYWQVYDIKTGNLLASETVTDLTDLAYDLAYDSTSGLCYGLSYNPEGDGAALASYDFSTSGYERTFIGDLKGMWNAIAVDKDGIIFAIDDSGILYNLDKETAEATQIGKTSYKPHYLASAVIDPKTNRMFWTICDYNTDGYLTEVNMETGRAKEVSYFNDYEHVIGLYIAPPEADPGAPAAPTNIKANFEQGSLSGTLTFDVPSTLFDGTPASGSVNYTIMANGKIISEEGAQTAYGATGVSIDYTALSSGNVSFTVFLSNETGESPRSKLTTYLGLGVPRAPRGLSAEYDQSSETFKISWLEVTSAEGEGYFNPSNVTYNIVRNDGHIVAEATPATEVTDKVPIPDILTAYSYNVTALFGGEESQATTSIPVYLGTAQAPYTNTFDNSLCGFTVLDVANDGSKWHWDDMQGGVARCDYHWANEMDDWLFSVPIRLKSDESYRLRFNAWGTNTYPERIEVKMGSDATPEAMTTILVEPTSVVSMEETPRFEVFINPETDGVYYLGFHGISDKDTNYLILDNIELSSSISRLAPSAVTDLNCEALPSGQRKIQLDFTAPATCIDGSPLDDLTRIDILRDDILVKSIDNPTPGNAICYIDEPGETGLYLYAVVPYNSNGAGHSATATCFCGIDEPLPPSNVVLTEGQVPGTIHVTWDPVTNDIHGTELSAEQVSYVVAVYNGYGWVPISPDLDETEYDYTWVDATTQGFIQVSVFAHTEMGYGEGTISSMIAVGKPYKSIHESFANAGISYIWANSDVNGGNWDVFNDYSFDDLMSYDSDNGFIGCIGRYTGNWAEFSSGKIDLSDLTSPELSFYIYNLVDQDPDFNKLTVRISDGGAEENFEDVFSKTIEEIAGEGAPEDWYRVSIPLDKYKGKTIRFALVAETDNYAWTLVDNVKLDNAFDNNLTAIRIEGPSTVVPGKELPLYLTIGNEGKLAPHDYTIEIFADGEKVKSIEGPTIEPYSTDEIRVALATSPLDTKTIEYSAAIAFDSDQKIDDNRFSSISVTPEVSKYPPVTGLTAEEISEGARIFWDAPDLSKAPSYPMTEDFEDGTSFAFKFNGWTFYDGDLTPLGGFTQLNLPGIIPGMTTGSFFVFDNEPYKGMTTSFETVSGTKFLAALYGTDIYNVVTTDDWAISPELFEGGQTIRFWAKSYSGSSPEKLIVLASEGSTNPMEFTEILTIDQLPDYWDIYEVYLPRGSRRFAINSCATDGFMLMIDDVEYISADGLPIELALKGYNIWRDGHKINSEPISEKSFIDTDYDKSQHQYIVTAVYDRGESFPSESVSIGTVGISEITSGAKISAGHGAINVTGNDGERLIIRAIDGKIIYNGKGNLRLNVASGIYVITTGSNNTKVIVNQ